MRDKIRTKIRWTVILSIFLCISFYAYFEVREILAGPIIEIFEPKNGMTATDEKLFIRGTVKNVSSITLNGRPVYADSKGDFSERIFLFPGYNRIAFEAKDRLGNKTEKNIEIVLAGNSPAPTTTVSLAKPLQ